LVGEEPGLFCDAHQGEHSPLDPGYIAHKHPPQTTAAVLVELALLVPRSI
jgi:hypothetical protein